MTGLFVVVESGDSSTLVRVRDDAHKGVMATFLYDQAGLIQSIEVAGDGITVTQIRDLPLARWESAAFGNAFSGSGGAETVDDLVDRIHPDARGKAATPYGRRHLAALTKLAVAAVEYRGHLAAGRRDPAAEIARRHGVSPTTARSWLHRARAAGFLEPARGCYASLARDGGVSESTIEQVYGRG